MTLNGVAIRASLRKKYLLKDLEEEREGATWISIERGNVYHAERIARTKVLKWDIPGMFWERLGGQFAWSEGSTRITVGNKMNKRVLQTMKGF